MKRITQQEASQYRLLDHDFIRRHGMRQVIAFTLTPIHDEPGWEEVTYYGASWVDPTNIPQRPHYIYILVNPSVPGICKIGYTKEGFMIDTDSARNVIEQLGKKYKSSEIN